MFALPSGQQTAEGGSDDNPIRLEGIEVFEFKRLLKVLYPSLNTNGSISTTDEEWKSILKLATLSRFLEIRTLAIQKLNGRESLKTFEKIALGRKYFVADWVRSGYVDLVKQNETPTIENVDMIGYAAGIRIFRLREEMRRKARKKVFVEPQSPFNYGGQDRCYSCSTSVKTRRTCEGCVEKLTDMPYEMESAINKEFSVELENIRKESVPYDSYGWPRKASAGIPIK
ncbi:hypothetical protein VKT23_007921 [Stygiomarasmius scandens]|uniref:BTB domain-containing protein n=1 Tax=Marasmiellus scandens TaxID=2682957 RepID=A0ABR1JNG3_9AGAR